MTTAVLLTLLGALSRLIPHPPNFVALGALALYSGARLPRRWAWAVPLLALALAAAVRLAAAGRDTAPARPLIAGWAAILGGTGLPQAAVDRLTSVTIGSYVVPIVVDVGVLVAFSAVMLGIAMRSFRHRD